MDDDARRVQDTAQARRAGPFELLQGAPGKVARVGAGPYLLTRARERSARGGDRERPRRGGEPLVAEQLVDRGEVPQAHVRRV